MQPCHLPRTGRSSRSKLTCDPLRVGLGILFVPNQGAFANKANRLTMNPPKAFIMIVVYNVTLVAFYSWDVFVLNNPEVV